MANLIEYALMLSANIKHRGKRVCNNARVKQLGGNLAEIQGTFEIVFSEQDFDLMMIEVVKKLGMPKQDKEYVVNHYDEDVVDALVGLEYDLKEARNLAVGLSGTIEERVQQALKKAGINE